MQRTRNMAALLGATATILLVGCDVQTGGQVAADGASNSTPAPTASNELAVNTTPVSPEHDHATPVKTLTADSPVNWIVRPDVETLDLGTFSTKDTGTGTVKLTNTGDTPMTIERAQTSCGCTTAGLRPNTIVGPGESVDVEIKLTGGPAEGTKTKVVTFHVKDHPKVRVNVRGTSVMYVKYEPADVIDPRQLEDGRLVLRSVDGQPFRILNTSADIFKELPLEAAVEHEVFIDFDKAREQARLLKRLTFHVDHPLCDDVPTGLNLRLLYEPDTTLANDRVREFDLSTDDEGVPIKSAPKIAGSQGVMKNAVWFASELKRGNAASLIEEIGKGEMQLEQRNREGSTLLDIAAQQGALDVMQALLDSGVDIESADNANRTPLMNAARTKQNAAVELLLASGARIDARDTIMNTALSWAAFQGTADTVKILIDAGSDVNIVGAATGWTPVIWASGFGDPASIKLLVDAGADLSTQDFIEGATALHHAARTGTVEHVQTLLDADADVKILDRNGKTPLIMACENSGGTADKVKMLVEAGSDLSAMDNRGMTALEHARKRTDSQAPAVVTYLESLGGNE